MKTKSKKSNDRLYVLYKMLVAYNTIYGFPQRGDEEHRFIARKISNTIYDLTPIFTGFVSREAVANVIRGESTISTLVPEHFKSRQKSGAQVIMVFEQEVPTFNRFVDFVSPFCLTHRTTREENTRLSPFQASCDTWVEAYNQAGVDLIDVGYCNVLTNSRLEKCKDLQPTALETVDRIIHDHSRYVIE